MSSSNVRRSREICSRSWSIGGSGPKSNCSSLASPRSSHRRASLAARSGSPSRAQHHAVRSARGVAADQAGAHVLGHPLGLAIERRAQAAGAGGREHQLVARAAPAGSRPWRADPGPSRPHARALEGAGAVAPAGHAPREGVRAIVLEADQTVLEERVDLLHAVSAAVVPGPAGVSPHPVSVDAQGVVLLEVLGGDGLEQRPPGVAVEAVAGRPGRDPAVQDLEDLVGLAAGVDARVDEVRARPVAAGHRELRRAPSRTPRRRRRSGAPSASAGCRAAPGSCGLSTDPSGMLTLMMS